MLKNILLIGVHDQKRFEDHCSKGLSNIDIKQRGIILMVWRGKCEEGSVIKEKLKC